MRFLKLGFALVSLLFLQIDAIESEEEANPCPDDSLPCDSGKCVRREEWCDGQKNCDDNSDESYCKKGSFWIESDPNRCKETHLLCDDGRCRPRVAKCDGHTDCKDGSDELRCGIDTIDNYYDYDNTETSSDIHTASTTTVTHLESDNMDDPDFSITTTQVPTEGFTQDAPLSSSAVNFYTNRMEQERGQTHLQSLPAIPSRSTTTSGLASAPERGHNLGIIQIIPSSRPLQSTPRPTTIAYETERFHDPPPTPVPVSPRQSSPERFPDTSLNPTVYPPVQYNGQTNTPNHQSTRSYVVGQNSNQHHTQSSIVYDSRKRNLYDTHKVRYFKSKKANPFKYLTRLYDTIRDPSKYHNETTRNYDYREDHPQYQTQPTIPYESRRDPNQFHNQPTRVYDSIRDPQPQQYQTQPTTTYDSSQPTITYDSSQPTITYDSSQPTITYDSSQPTITYDSSQPTITYDSSQPTITYDSRRNPDQYHNQPTRVYDSRRYPQPQNYQTQNYESRIDSYQYQTHPSRPDESKRPVLKTQPQYLFHTTITPTLQNHYAAVTQRAHVDQENFYDGYYDRNGHSVVLRTSSGQKAYRINFCLFCLFQ